MFSGKMDSHNASSTSRPAPAAPRRRTGRRCCCACICAGPSARLQAEVIDRTAGEVAGIKSATVESGRVRLRLAAHRDRRAPPGAQVAVRFRQPPPHLVRLGVRLARGRRRHRDRDQSGRPEGRRLSLDRRRRPARQQDRVGGAHHAHARPASSSRARTSAASTRTAPTAMKMLKAKLYELEVQQAQRRREGRSRRPSRTSAGATRSAPTCSTSRASRICAPASSGRHAERARRRSRRVPRGELEAGRVVRTHGRQRRAREQADRRAAREAARRCATARQSRSRTTSAATRSRASCTPRIGAHGRDALEAEPDRACTSPAA